MIFKKAVKVLFLDYAINNIIQILAMNTSPKKSEFDLLLDSIKHDSRISHHDPNTIENIIKENYTFLYNKFIYMKTHRPELSVYDAILHKIKLYLGGNRIKYYYDTINGGFKLI